MTITMADKIWAVVNRLGVVLFVILVFWCVYEGSRFYQTHRQLSTQDTPDTQLVFSQRPNRWAVVEAKFYDWHEDEEGDRWVPVNGLKSRTHIVSPEGTWYIVPEAQQDFVDRIIEGQEVQLPEHVRQWDTTTYPRPSYSYQSEEDAGRTRAMLKGYSHELRMTEGISRYVEQGIVFYAE